MSTSFSSDVMVTSAGTRNVNNDIFGELKNCEKTRMNGIKSEKRVRTEEREREREGGAYSSCMASRVGSRACAFVTRFSSSASHMPKRRRRAAGTGPVVSCWNCQHTNRKTRNAEIETEIETNSERNVFRIITSGWSSRRSEMTSKISSRTGFSRATPLIGRGDTAESSRKLRDTSVFCETARLRTWLIRRIMQREKEMLYLYDREADLQQLQNVVWEGFFLLSEMHL
jgi:hypothetical protein